MEHLKLTDVSSEAQQQHEDANDTLTLSSKAQLRSTLSFIKKASNDSEKLAGILLVTKVFMSTRPDTKSICEIYAAIGFKFIKKLLRSQERLSSDGAVKSDYPALGLSMLTCFTSVEELAMGSELGQLTTDVLAVLATLQPNDEKEVIENAIFVLCNLVKSETGSRVFLGSPAIAKLLENEFLTNERCRELVDIFTVALSKIQCWCINSKTYCKLLLVIFLRLSNIRDNESFQIWKSIAHLLSAADRFVVQNDILGILTDPESRELCKVICEVLIGVIKSRVPVDVRRDGILIAYYVISCFGVKWIYTYTSTNDDMTSGQQLLTLILTLAAVEVKMLIEAPDSLENKNRENIKSDIVAYFAIAEKVTIFLVNGGHDQLDQQDDGSTLTSSEHVIKACCGLDDLIGSVLKYLKRELSKNCTATALTDQVVVAAYRAVCAWLSEETEALREEVQEIIPAMIKLAEIDFAEYKATLEGTSSQAHQICTKQRPNLLEFLLPVLCHLTADPAMRKTLLYCEAHLFLMDFLVLTLENFCANNLIVGEQLETILGVFLNICVTEPDLISKDKIFSEVMDNVIDVIPHIYITNRLLSYQLLASLVALGLMLSKHLKEHLQKDSNKSENFLSTSLTFLVDTCPVYENLKTLPDDAKSFTDLWCISFSNLIGLWKSFDLTLELRADFNVREKIKLLSSQAKNSKVKLDHDINYLLEAFIEFLV